MDSSFVEPAAAFMARVCFWSAVALVVATGLPGCADRDRVLFAPLPHELSYPWVAPERATAQVRVAWARARARTSVHRAVISADRLATDWVRAARRDAERAAAIEAEDVRHRSAVPTDLRSTRVDINRATLAELQRLPRIGPAIAQRVIDHRPYEAIDDLARVPGIGPATLDQIRSHVRVGLVRPRSPIETPGDPIPGQDQLVTHGVGQALIEQPVEVPGRELERADVDE